MAAGWLLCACSGFSRTDPSITPAVPPLLITAGASTEIPEPQTAVAQTKASATPKAILSTLTDTPPAEPFAPTATLTVAPQTFYHLQATLDYLQHHVTVKEQVVYTHAVPEATAELVLLVEPNRYWGSFALSQVSWGDGSLIAEFTLQGNRLTIPLQPPLEYGGQIDLRIAYELNLPEIPPPDGVSRPQPYGYTSLQTNLVDWYPVLPPYQPGTGWLAHDPGYFGEHQVYQSADYQVEISVTDPFPAGQPLVVAASAPVEIEGSPYSYVSEDARNFAWSASHAYTVYTAQVGEVTVRSYALPFSGEGGEAALQNAAEAIVLFSRLFGARPLRSLSIVEADFLDGMEYEGLFFLSQGFYNLYDGTPAGYLTAITVHETAHQWWYSLVGNDQAFEPWLDEALCTYSEKLFYEHTYPELVDWWWSYRVNFYQPAGFVNGSIYDFNAFRPYRDAVYLRGAQFLEALRQAVGDEAFFAFLQDYAAQKAHGTATAEDFFRILKKHSNADIEPLLREYFK